MTRLWWKPFLPLSLAALLYGGGISAALADEAALATSKMHYLRAQIALKQGKPAEARTLLQSISEETTNSIGGYAKLRICDTLNTEGKYEESLALARQLAKDYKTTEPVIAAWASYTIGATYHMAGKQDEAIAACKETALAWIGLDDLGPVLAARNKLGAILQHIYYSKGEDQLPEMLKIDPQDAKMMAWAHGICAAQRASWGDIAKARQEYQSAAEAVGNDKERAIMAFQLACAEIECFDRGRRLEQSVFDSAEAFAKQLLEQYPSEQYLASQLRTALGEHFVSRSQPDEADVYIRPIVGLKTDTSTLAWAYYLLSQVAAVRGDELGRLQALQDMRRACPFSQYDDLALGDLCNAQLSLKMVGEAAITRQMLLDSYPQSTHVERVNKGMQAAGFAESVEVAN